MRIATLLILSTFALACEVPSPTGEPEGATSASQLSTSYSPSPEAIRRFNLWKRQLPGVSDMAVFTLLGQVPVQQAGDEIVVDVHETTQGGYLGYMHAQQHYTVWLDRDGHANVLRQEHGWTYRRFPNGDLLRLTTASDVTTGVALMDARGEIRWRKQLTGRLQIAPQALQTGIPEDIDAPSPTKSKPGFEPSLVKAVKGDIWSQTSQSAAHPYPSSAALLDRETGEVLGGVMAPSDKMAPL